VLRFAPARSTLPDGAPQPEEAKRAPPPVPICSAADRRACRRRAATNMSRRGSKIRVSVLQRLQPALSACRTKTKQKSTLHGEKNRKEYADKLEAFNL
jgi:hypothetical protein